ncbi:MAG: amidase [Betaproteobacteria bacterium]|nr:amidase [Betaproteobacteria bacterium]MBI2960328.1 amidase [Betaproteobacteria bacterium]
MPADFAFLDATAQAELVRRNEVAPIDLVDAAIERIERLNPRLNAVVTTMYDEARRIARGSLPAGPFSGVPFLLKDSLASYAGARMTSGSRLLRERVAGHDSELVRRLKRAGLIVLGKTNCAEFGLLPTTEPQLFGATRNPWNLHCSPGGSSGGSAAAVAAGMVAIAHGSDGGGSIRIPASCCGVFGLKPTRARNPLGPDHGDVHSGLVVEHALTRSVRDSAALLDATGGPDLGDPYCAPPPQRPFLHEVGADPGRLRIAFSAHTVAPVHRDCAGALHDAATLCGELGHEMTEAQPRIDYQSAAQSFAALWAAGCAATIDGIARSSGKSVGAGDVEPLTWALYEMGRRVSASDYQLAIAELQALSRSIARFFTAYDVWLTPVLAEPPPVLGSFDAPLDDPLAAFRRAWAFAPITGICNFTGQPAMSVPLYWNTEGLPIGSHFAGRFGDEATLFRLAAQLEQARPWACRRPAWLAPKRLEPGRLTI